VILIPWAVALGFITWRDLASDATLKAQHSIAGLPLPADYAATFLLFGGLGLLGKTKAAPAAALAAWGIDIALGLEVFGGGNPVGNALISGATKRFSATTGGVPVGTATGTAPEKPRPH
jgi:hypothetical protein